MKTIHAALAAFILAAAQPAFAETLHIRGVPVPPIQTVEQARAETEKRLAAIQAREAEEAKVAAQVTSSPSAITHSPLFFTGKPLVEETGQYVFLFRHYDPELNRWTTSDPSGFPDGANNIAYMAVPTCQFDWQGLKSVAWIGAETSQADPGALLEFNTAFNIVYSSMLSQDADSAAGPNPTHYLDDGDTFSLYSISAFNTLGGFSSYDQIYLIGHGDTLGGFWIGEIKWTTSDIYSSFSNVVNVQGCIYGTVSTGEVVLNHFSDPTFEFLFE